MTKTPKRARTTVSVANLERLGVSRLAGLLIGQARRDRALRETLARVLAEAAGEDELHDYIERRLLALAKGRPLDRDGTKTLARELDALRLGIVDVIARKDAAIGIGLLRRMIDLGPAIIGRAPPPREQLVAWQAAVLADLARLWGANPPPDPDDIVAMVVDCCTRDDDAILDATTILAPVLGDSGLRRLRERLKAELDELPAGSAGGRWGTAGPSAYLAGTRAWRLRRRLGEIADLLGDVDGYIALERAQPRAQINVRAIVERLLKAKRGEEALAWLDDARYHNRLIATLDLRLATLEALGRRDEAQALRWQRFERQLDRGMLKDHLKRLPDFTDFEAERRAMEHVLAARSATEALAFLLAWPDFDSAARLVRQRHGEFGATPPETLLAAAEALRERHPHETVIAVRIAVLGVLQRGLTRLFEKAAHALADSAAIEPPTEPGPDHETHAAFVDRLRQLHPRQWGFWRIFDSLVG